MRAVHTQQLFKASSGEGAGTQQQEEGNNVVDAQEHLCNALLVENTQLADAILKLSLYKPPNMPKARELMLMLLVYACACVCAWQFHSLVLRAH